MSARKGIRKRLWEKDPHCCWCGRLTQLITPKHGEPTPPDMATIEHLYSKLDEQRKSRGMKLLACYECNHNRGNSQVETLAKEEQHKRSGRSPTNGKDLIAVDDQVKVFATCMQRYLGSPPQIQQIINEMLAILADPKTTTEEKERATAAVREAIFPFHRGELAPAEISA
jgi:hypothetical protein